jgi:hypothetical protein
MAALFRHLSTAPKPCSAAEYSGHRMVVSWFLACSGTAFGGQDFGYCHWGRNFWTGLDAPLVASPAELQAAGWTETKAALRAMVESQVI